MLASLLTPGVRILGGRVVNQTGVLVALLAPSFTLADPAYADLLVAFTVTSIAVTAVLGSLQAALVRAGEGDPLFDRSVRVNATLGVVGVPLATLLTLAWLGSTSGPDVVLAFAYGLGALAAADIMLGASTLAASGHPTRSATVEAIAGGLLVATSVVLLVVDEARPWMWAVGFAASMCGATAIRFTTGLHHRPAAGAHPPLVRLAWSAVSAGRTFLAAGLVTAAFNRADFLVMSQVAEAAETSRYGIAVRFAGPLLVALGALNNSLYVRQVAVNHDVAAVVATTVPTRRRVLRAAGAFIVGPLLLVVVADLVLDDIARRELVLPVAILLVAGVVYAGSVPWGFALNATHHEAVWTTIVLAGLVVDLAAVVVVGDRGAVAVAWCWLGTQVVVAGGVALAKRRYLVSVPSGG